MGRPLSPGKALSAVFFSASLAACASARAPLRDLPFAPPPASAMSLKLHAFNTGEAGTFRGAAARGQSWLKRLTMDMPAFVIEHPTGLVVFDTGLPPVIAEHPWKYMGLLNRLLAPFKMRPGQDLVSQMKAAGLDPAAVRWVVVSHRHFDHNGCLRAFPNATVVVSQREFDAAHGRYKGDRITKKPPTEIFEGLAKLRLVDFSSAPAFATFEHGVDLLGDGSVVLLEAWGHTAGSMAAFVRSGPEGALLTGDASWTEINYGLPAEQLYAYDMDAHWKRLWQIKLWKERTPGLLVLPGHDLGPLRGKALPHAVLHG